VSEAHLLQRRARATDNVALMRPMRMFHWSNMYLSLLFLSVALDPLLTR
jgi:protoheme IX farnesyltransferase